MFTENLALPVAINNLLIGNIEKFIISFYISFSNFNITKLQHLKLNYKPYQIVTDNLSGKTGHCLAMLRPLDVTKTLLNAKFGLKTEEKKRKHVDCESQSV